MEFRRAKKMTRENLINIINRAIRVGTITAKDLDLYRTNVECNGKAYDVYLAGNDEMFDLNEFYQIGIDPINDKIYKFFFEVGQEDLGDIDYSKAYRMEEIGS